MPAKKHNRPQRNRRQQPRQRAARPVVQREEPAAPVIAEATDAEGIEGPSVVPVAATTRPAPASRTTGATARAGGAARTARTRTARPPAQVVIQNYDYLRRDLRTLGLLAPSLVIIMVVLSFVLH